MNKIKKNMAVFEQQILEQAFKAINENAFTLKEDKFALYEPNEHLHQDGFIAELQVGSTRLKYFVQIKKTISKADTLMLSKLSKDSQLPTIFLTKYVNPKMAEELKHAGVEFADTAGNVFLNRPPVLIFIKGNKQQDTGKVVIKRAFKKAGLKIIFALLINPGCENATYREIAKAAEVSLGSVDYTMTDLKDLGYLRKRNNGSLFLVQKEELVKRWVQAYSEQLRPKLILGTFSGPDGWWNKTKISPIQGLWGGEVAAQTMADFLNPQIITIYSSPQNLNSILLANRLKKDPQGNVEILDQFWCAGNKKNADDLVHPLLVYADLIASGDPRNAEVAEKIYEQHLVKFIR